MSSSPSSVSASTPAAAPLFTAEIAHTEKSIELLFRTQRRSYDRLRIILRLLLGFGLVLAVVLFSLATWLKALLLLAGAWLMASADFPAQIRADRAVQARKGQLPKMCYDFYDDHLHLSGEGSMDIAYRKLTRLVEDRDYYYLFLTRDSVCMLSRASLKPDRQDEFRKLLEDSSGHPWRAEKSLLSFNLADLIVMLRDRKGQGR
ncbi:MAG: YcxB family protein [Oscillospiraceae bacterium]|nr:YcxB family protein [Oscillospiraceae bacterium]